MNSYIHRDRKRWREAQRQKYKILDHLQDSIPVGHQRPCEDQVSEAFAVFR